MTYSFIIQLEPKLLSLRVENPLFSTYYTLIGNEREKNIYYV